MTWRIHPAVAPCILPLLFVAVALTLSGAQGFYQYHNDFWDTYLAARRFVVADATTWFNGQYPIANLLTVRAFMAGGNPVPAAIFANTVIAGLTLALLGMLARTVLSPAWAVFVVTVTAVFPEFFRYAGAAGGDPAAALLFTGGLALVFRERLRDPSVTPRRALPWLLAGGLMGVAALFRYHAFVGGVLGVIALVAAAPGPRRGGLWLALGLCLGFAPQWGVNLAAGRGLFETGFGPMNVYHLMYGMNWQRVTDLTVTGSSASIIAADPVLFATRYLASLWSFKHLWGPPLAALALVRDPATRRALGPLALWSCLYFGAFSATSSGRQGLLALPFSMLTLGLCFEAARGHLAARFAPGGFARRAGSFALVGIASLLLMTHLARDARLARARGGLAAEAARVQQVLATEGVVHAAGVFTTDYDLYFPAMRGLVPRTNGGAVRLGTDWYDAAFPEFAAADAAVFAGACRAQGVTVVVFDEAARDLSPAMGALYDAARRGVDTAGFSLAARTPRHVILRVP